MSDPASLESAGLLLKFETEWKPSASSDSSRFEMKPRHSILRVVAGAALGVLASAGPSARGALIWSDEFNQEDGTGPDESKWVYDIGRGVGGWGNNELQTYTNARANSFVVSDPAATDGKALAIRAIRDNNGAYTSARIKTLGKFSTTHGRLEARLKLTKGRGLWPAFWALGANIDTVGWPASGEIDVVEQLGHEPAKIYGSIHAPGFMASSTTTVPAGTSLTDDYHVYSVVWSEGRIEWFLDWESYAVKTIGDVPPGGQWGFEHPFFLLLNLAVGGNFPGNPDATSVFPQTLYIDYVRVHTIGPEPPRYLGAFSDKPGEIALSWTMASTMDLPVIGHELERAEDSEFTVNYLQRSHDATPFLVDDGLVPGKEYFYRVATVTAEGVSSFSSPAFARVSGPGDASSGDGNLMNCSTRAVVGDNAVAIAGFVVGGREPRRVLVRAIGPALRAFGVSDALPDPVLTLRPLGSEQILATNDNWGDRPERDEIVAATKAIGAFKLDPAGRDAAILITLPPGGYTAVIEARNGQKGVVLAEIYEAK